MTISLSGDTAISILRRRIDAQGHDLSAGAAEAVLHIHLAEEAQEYDGYGRRRPSFAVEIHGEIIAEASNRGGERRLQCFFLTRPTALTCEVLC